MEKQLLKLYHQNQNTTEIFQTVIPKQFFSHLHKENPAVSY